MEILALQQNRLQFVQLLKTIEGSGGETVSGGNAYNKSIPIWKKKENTKVRLHYNTTLCAGIFMHGNYLRNSVNFGLCNFQAYHIVTLLGKPHWKSCRVYSGIAQTAIAPPPPSLKRALWGTLFPGRQMPFELQFSLHKCPKPSWQGFRPPKK